MTVEPANCPRNERHSPVRDSDRIPTSMMFAGKRKWDGTWIVIKSYTCRNCMQRVTERSE